MMGHATQVEANSCNRSSAVEILVRRGGLHGRTGETRCDSICAGSKRYPAVTNANGAGMKGETNEGIDAWTGPVLPP
jgi:hypothetical protein